MLEESELGEGWQVWNESTERIVLTYRPDVFDGSAYPAACLPTIYVTRGRRGRRPPGETPPPDASWYVTLFLEPDVSCESGPHETRADALADAVDRSVRFAAGEVDYRGLYQVPREAYFDRLDELTGR